MLACLPACLCTCVRTSICACVCAFMRACLLACLRVCVGVSGDGGVGAYITHRNLLHSHPTPLKLTT